MAKYLHFFSDTSQIKEENVGDGGPFRHLCKRKCTAILRYCSATQKFLQRAERKTPFNNGRRTTACLLELTYTILNFSVFFTSFQNRLL